MNSGDQIWACTICANQRRFGSGFPDDPTEICWLGCDFCEQASTPHKFSHVEFEQSAPSNRGGFRPGAGRKPQIMKEAR